MCGRITQRLPPDRIGELYGVRPTPLPPDQPPCYNAAPGQDFSACRPEPDGPPLSLAALWEHWDQVGDPLETLSIITTAASPGLVDIHHCQPAIIDPRWFTQWLDPLTPLPALLELARQPHDGPFERRAVSTRVNSVRNDDPDILTPAQASGLF